MSMSIIKPSMSASPPLLRSPGLLPPLRLPLCDPRPSLRLPLPLLLPACAPSLRKAIESALTWAGDRGEPAAAFAKDIVL